MRPRVFPAEDKQEAQSEVHASTASMRPRVFPAEDGTTPGPLDRGIQCFNEAAGIPRGRLNATTTYPEVTMYASMRPRVFPAEDAAIMQAGSDAGLLQ